MLVHEIVLVVISYVVLAGTVWAGRRLVRNPETRYELQRQAYLARRGVQIAVALLQLVSAFVAAALGVASVRAGYFSGWACFAFAGVPVVFLVLKIYIARLPFTYPEDL